MVIKGTKFSDVLNIYFYGTKSYIGLCMGLWPQLGAAVEVEQT